MTKRDYECSRCGLDFETNDELQEHRREAHGDEIAAAVKAAEDEVRKLDRM